MATITEIVDGVTVGVDTHADIHVAAVLDPVGRLLATESFAADGRGYGELVGWARSHGPISVAAVEGTSSWGAGLARHLNESGVACVEVNRPNRQHRRRHGKSDTADAIAAARAAQSGQADATPKAGNGPIESLRMLRAGLRSATKARTQAINQLRSLISTAPEQLKADFAELTRTELISKATRLRPGTGSDPATIAKITLRSLARRINYLNEEIADLRQHRDAIIDAVAPAELMDQHGLGPATATDILIAFGDNPERIRTEAGFAALCGVSPVDASSGRQRRHRLNRGGDRQANHALWRIVMVRLSTHQPTRDYATKSTTNGKTKRETIRTLKRYTARQIWRTLQHHPPQLDR